MNYFEFHLGDWAAATGHLSWDEETAYMRLLRAYYHGEAAIPKGQQYRLAKAATAAQKRAVDAVIAEFFTESDSAFHQKRADEEIARFQDKQRKAKASANARWSQSEGTANAMRTHTERNALHDAFALPTQSDGNALQTPDSSNQTPVTRKEPESEGLAPQPNGKHRPKTAKRCPPDFVPDLAFAISEIPDIDPDREAQKFRDWEFKTPRSDWSACWRTWVRNARDRGNYSKKAGIRWE